MSVDEADHFYLPRSGQRQLLAALCALPALAEELAITETRQGVIARQGLASPRRPKKLDSQMPYHAGAFEAAVALHNDLAGWVRMVMEQRSDLEWPADNLVNLARWLRLHIIALAKTPGAETAADAIAEHVAWCRTVIDLPPDDDVVIDAHRLAAANASVLTAYQVEKIAMRLGAVGAGLTRDRIRTLVRGKMLWPCGTDEGTDFYRLGDVLAAHTRHARRKRGA